MISQSTIEKVFDAAQVEEVIGDFVHLKKSGSNFKGLSPFVDEKTPSFMVSPSKQIWKDFSSGKGGNAVSFLMEHEQFSYPEAIKYLADKYSIEYEETQQTDTQKELASEKESMYLVSKFAKACFHKNLFETEEGKAIGLSYFKERGYNNETIEKFELGYGIDAWESFTNQALKKGYELKYLEKTGLTIVKEDRKFDRFKGRVLFPIHSLSGRTLGFGGRTLSTDKKAAKYLNSPESEIYHKSKVLYGMFHAKQCIVKEDNCYLVEGYTDVLSLYQAGVKNVVASSGTALTENQIKLIKRFTSNITVLFDGDEAGIRASLRGIDLILEQGMNVKVITFPSGDDPDSYSKKVSNTELTTYLNEHAQDFINFKSSLLLKESKNDPVKKAGVIHDIVHSISKIPSKIQQEVYIQSCANLLNISESALHNQLAQLSSKLTQNISKKNQQAQQPMALVNEVVEKVDPLLNLEKEIIKILLLYGNELVDFVDWVPVENEEGEIKLTKETYNNTVSKEIYLQLQDDEIEFTHPIFKILYTEITNQLNQNEPINTTMFTNHQNQEVATQASSIFMDEEKYTLSKWEAKNIYVKEKKEALPKLITDVILNLRNILIEKKIEQLAEESKEEANRKTTIEMVMSYSQLKKQLFEKLNRVV